MVVRRRSVSTFIVAVGVWTASSITGGPASGQDAGISASTWVSRDSISVDQCASLARERSLEVRTLADRVRGAAFDSIAAAHNRRPGFALEGGALIAPRGFYDPAITNLGDYDLRAVATWPLADGGDRSRERRLKGLESTGNRMDLAAGARDISIRAATLALDLVLLRDRAGAQRQTLDWLGGLEDLVSSGVRGGGRSPSDTVRLALERDALRSELRATLRDSSAQSRELAEFLRTSPDSLPPVRRPDPGYDIPPAGADSTALLAAAERRPEVEGARVALDRRRLDLDAARNRNALRVDLVADAGVAGTDLTRLVPPNLSQTNPGAGGLDRVKRDLGASLAIQATLPFGDVTSGSNRAAREAEVAAAASELDRVEARTRRETLDLLRRWRDAALDAEAARASTERAAENLLTLKSLYAAGETSLLDLLDARGALDDARDRLLDARRELWSARFTAEALR